MPRSGTESASAMSLPEQGLGSAGLLQEDQRPSSPQPACTRRCHTFVLVPSVPLCCHMYGTMPVLSVRRFVFYGIRTIGHCSQGRRFVKSCQSVKDAPGIGKRHDPGSDLLFQRASPLVPSACRASLPCSEWERVFPRRYDHQSHVFAGTDAGVVSAPSKLYEPITSPTD